MPCEFSVCRASKRPTIFYDKEDLAHFNVRGCAVFYFSRVELPRADIGIRDLVRMPANAYVSSNGSLASKPSLPHGVVGHH